MDNAQRTQIQRNLRRIDQLLATGFLKPEHVSSVLGRAVLLDVLVCLRDLVRKCELDGKRIAFTDDINVSPEVPDITSLVTFMRDALCHVDSRKHYLEVPDILATMNWITGLGSMKINEYRLVSPYPDDAALFIGPQRLLIKRHVLRCIEEARAILAPYL